MTKTWQLFTLQTNSRVADTVLVFSVVNDIVYFLISCILHHVLSQVQVRPWKLSDGECHYDTTKEVNSRLTAFVGGVPRPLRADQLAKIMSDHFGNVCYTVISVDDDMDYPRGKLLTKVPSVFCAIL